MLEQGQPRRAGLLAIGVARGGVGARTAVRGSTYLVVRQRKRPPLTSHRWNIFLSTRPLRPGSSPSTWRTALSIWTCSVGSQPHRQ